jgi:ABC-2 type transport system permease protein
VPDDLDRESEMMINAFEKYWKTIGIVATGSLHDSKLGMTAGLILRLLRVIILISLWRSVFGERASVGGMSLEAVMTYTLIAEAFSTQMSIRTALSDTLWEGIIANRLLRPIGIYGQFIAEMIGGWVPSLLLGTLPLLIVAPFLGIDVAPSSPAAVPLFVLSIAFGVGVGTALDVFFSACMVFLEQSVYALTQIRDAVSVLLSGAVLPLALLPWDLGEYLVWLPFAALASAPLQIYTGTGDPLFLLALQAGWMLVLWPLAHGFWSLSRERLVAHGG